LYFLLDWESPAEGGGPRPLGRSLGFLKKKKGLDPFFFKRKRSLGPRGGPGPLGYAEESTPPQGGVDPGLSAGVWAPGGRPDPFFFKRKRSLAF